MRDFRSSLKRRGAALLIVLAAVLLVGTLAAVGGARRYALRAEEKRADRLARLRVAVWDAAWTGLKQSSALGAGLTPGGRQESPDGIQTELSVRPVQGKSGRREEDLFEMTVTATLDKEKHEAWARVRRQGNRFRILTWVEP